MPAYERTDRISEEVRRELDNIILSLNDPRIRGTYSIVRCEVTRDLKYCKARVSVLEDEYRDGLLAALKNAAGFIRRELGKKVQLRIVPAITFEADKNIEYAAYINKILLNDERNGEDDDNP